MTNADIINHSQLIDQIIEGVQIKLDKLLKEFWYKVKRLKKYVSALFVILFVINFGMVVYQVVQGNPYETADIYDGATSISIAKLPFDQIYTVLQNEQNFTLFYYVIKALLLTPLGMTGVKLFLFGTWVLSIVLFFICLKSFISNKNTLIILTAMYSITPSLVYYASYPRMYGLINVLILLLIILFTKYLVKSHTGYVLAISLVLIIMANLHVMAGIVSVITFIAAVFTFKNKKHMVVLFITIGIIGVMSGIQIIQKPQWQDIYLGRGVDYLNNVMTAFYNFPEALLLQTTSSYSWAFYIAFMFSLYYVVKTTGFKSKKQTLPLLFTAAFIVINITSKQFANYRHFIFFVGPLLLISFYGLSLMKGRIRLLVLSVYVTYFLVMGFASNIARTVRDAQVKEVCNEMRTLTNGVIVTDYYFLNYVNYCLTNFKGEKVVVFEDEIDYITHKSELELLIREANIAGYTNHWSYSQALGGRKLEDMTKETTVKHVLQQNNVQPGKKVYLLNTNLKRTAVYFYENAFMDGFTFAKRIGPSIVEYDWN